MTTWYLQSDANWSEATWNDAPDGSGNAGTPTTGDTANCNGHTLSIDTTPGCAAIQGAWPGSWAIVGDQSLVGVNVAADGGIPQGASLEIGDASYVGTVGVSGTLIIPAGKTAARSGSGEVCVYEGGLLQVHGRMTNDTVGIVLSAGGSIQVDEDAEVVGTNASGFNISGDVQCNGTVAIPVVVWSTGALSGSGTIQLGGKTLYLTGGGFTLDDRAMLQAIYDGGEVSYHS